MKQPLWRCRQCGERLYGHIEGGYQCRNCEQRYDPAELVESTA